jgi:hypothetical protein
LADLEREVLRKLRRTMRSVHVVYAARSSTGLFARPGEHYGEVWYALGTKREMTRSTTEPIVLEVIFGLAGIPRPGEAPEEAAYPGYPLAKRPRLAAPFFYALWPLVIAAGWTAGRRRRARA